jgi:hypothetical protein
MLAGYAIGTGTTSQSREEAKMERITDGLTRLSQISESPKSHATSPSSPLVPDRETAALLSGVIDRARAAVGWGRLSEKEHNIAIVAWFEILHDAGVEPAEYSQLYRAAQQHKRELVAQGQPLTIVTPHDLCAELDKIRRMNAELDKARLLPENAAGACLRCGGNGFEVMPDGKVRPGCQHAPVTDEERAQRKQFQAEMIAQALKEARKAKSIRPEPPPRIERVKGETLHCSECPRTVNTLGGWQEGEPCGVAVGRGDGVEGALHRCTGRMIGRGGTPTMPIVETPEGQVSAQMPFMITASMRARLSELGYSETEIDNLTPAEAHEIINAGE